MDILHGFSGPDGDTPFAGLVEGSDGALYGTTYYGGLYDVGTVFKINKDGSGFRKLHDFDSSDGRPEAGLIEASDGALYGTTEYGGVGYGVVFKINKDGTGLVTLHEFDSSDGRTPEAGLIEASDGALYGTTSNGGFYGWGVAFKINKDGTSFQILRDFDYNLGATPHAGLIEASDGALYGTTEYGGFYFYGVVFKLDKDGTDFHKRHDFSPDFNGGVQPYAGLVEASDGALYGTTYYGGRDDVGTVFKLNKDGTGYQELHDFDDGGKPIAGLIEASDGALYGTTYYGGLYGGGVVFRINKDGTGFLDLYDFTHGDMSGEHPRGGLVEGPDGVFYGTTSAGGPGGGGVVFRLSVGCEASLEVPGEIYTPGSKLPVHVHIAHHRPKTVTVPWELRLIDASGQVVVKHTTRPHTFEPGDVVDRNVEFRLPDDLASGTYTLRLAISGMDRTKGAKTTLRVVRAE